MSDAADSNEQRDVRLLKLETLRARGIDPFSVEEYARTHCAEEVLRRFDELDSQPASLAGRIVAIRKMGRAMFMHLEDGSGRLQVYFRRDDVGEDAYARLDLLDIGDFIGVKGTVFRTRTGETTLHGNEYTPLAKALRVPPIGKQREEEEFGGLRDVETRYRNRHLDLMSNPEVRASFVRRSRLIGAIRRFYESMDYLEVETPVLQSVAGGAAARPFVTHHNALKCDLHLRISLELYLKRLLVGGYERVFEIGRVFRNEGISTRHNPEFTMLESYEAYASLDGIMDLVEGLYRTVSEELHGGLRFPSGDEIIDLTRPFERLPILEGIKRYAGIAPSAFESLETAKKAAERAGLDTSEEHQIGGLIEKLHERFTQPHLIQPTFITDFPLETSPLAKKRRDDPRLVRRFEIYIAKQELGNAFSEINDPLDQRERFLGQAAMRASGDDEAHPFDEDFIQALEYGMPPAGGFGTGIDRLAMVFGNQPSIRDVVLFPQMRPE